MSAPNKQSGLAKYAIGAALVASVGLGSYLIGRGNSAKELAEQQKIADKLEKDLETAESKLETAESKLETAESNLKTAESNLKTANETIVHKDNVIVHKDDMINKLNEQCTKNSITIQTATQTILNLQKETADLTNKLEKSDQDNDYLLSLCGVHKIDTSGLPSKYTNPPPSNNFTPVSPKDDQRKSPSKAADIDVTTTTTTTK